MRAKFLLSLFAFVFGSSILVISLFSATQVAGTGDGAASEGKLYFSQEILPDHSLYKVMMAVDRLQLETASPQEQIYMRLEYATRRLEYAKTLLERENEPLALSTLLKSQQYLHEAVKASLKDTISQSTRDRVLKAVEFHSKELTTLAPDFNDANRAQIDRLLKEHDTLRTSLVSQ